MIGPRMLYCSHLSLAALSSFSLSLIRVSSSRRGSPETSSDTLSDLAWAASTCSCVPLPLASASFASWRAFWASFSRAPGSSRPSRTIRSISTTSTTCVATVDGRMIGLPSRSVSARGWAMTRMRKVPGCFIGISCCWRSPAKNSDDQRSEAPSEVTSAEIGSSPTAVTFARSSERRSKKPVPALLPTWLYDRFVSPHRFLNSRWNSTFAPPRPVTSVPLPATDARRAWIASA